ncbi:MAG: CopG family transcriptional regulator [Actinomycetota bacterium]
MLKTTVYIPDRLKRRLEILAARSGRSEAEVIRTAIERLLGSEAPPRPQLPLFHGPDPTLSERVDDLLAGLGE